MNIINLIIVTNGKIYKGKLCFVFMTEKNYLGANLRLLSAIYGWNQKEVAERLGRSPQQIGRYFCGEGIDLEMLGMIGNVFNVSLESLVNIDLRERTIESLEPHLRRSYKDWLSRAERSEA